MYVRPTYPMPCAPAPATYCPQPATIGSLEQALQELNQINTTFQTLSKSIVTTPTTAKSVVPSQPAMQQAAPLQQYSQTVMTHVSQPIPQPPKPVAAPTPQPLVQAPAMSSSLIIPGTLVQQQLPKDSLENSETQIDNLCRILENFITTISPEKPATSFPSSSGTCSRY